MNPELASLHLYKPYSVGAQLEPVENGDISWACWPSYRRTTLAVGGDNLASFSFSASDEILEKWFGSYLGHHFEERWGGRATFVGLIWAMRLSYNGVVLYVSLDQLYNAVEVRYKTDSAAAETDTSQATNANSIAKFGTKELLHDLGSFYVPSTTAETYRDNLLALLAVPRASIEEARLQGASQPGILDVEVRGYIHTLNNRLYTNAGTSNVDINTEIEATLGTPDFVTVGDVEANTTEVSEEADHEPIWDRVKKIIAVGSASNGRWVAGCFAGLEFTYKQADETAVAYYQELITQQKFTRDGLWMSPIPAALIRPGGVLFVNDIMAGRPVASTLLDDPRATFVDVVEYSINGATLKSNSSAQSKANALAMAIMANQKPKSRPVEFSTGSRLVPGSNDLLPPRNRPKS